VVCPIISSGVGIVAFNAASNGLVPCDLLEPSLGLDRSYAGDHWSFMVFLDTTRKIVEMRADMVNGLDRTIEHGSCTVYNYL
jgi:hypothetical protein